MNQMQIFNNRIFKVGVVVEDGSALFDAESVAQSLGITDFKNGRNYVRWARVNEYLGGNSPDVAKGDLIPESMVYKLAFKASNETAEKFQDWLAIDVIPQIRKTGSYSPDVAKLPPELQLMNALVQQINTQALNQLKLQTTIEETKQELKDMRDVVEIKPFDNWRDDTNGLINKICKVTGDYKDIRHKIYDALNQRARVDIKRRLENMKMRALVAGMSRSKADNLTYLDVIAEDKKLIEIYTAIVKEMAIKKGVA